MFIDFDIKFEAYYNLFSPILKVFLFIFSATIFTLTQMQWMEDFSYAVGSWLEGRVAPDTFIVLVPVPAIK